MGKVVKLLGDVIIFLIIVGYYTTVFCFYYFHYSRKMVYYESISRNVQHQMSDLALYGGDGIVDKNRSSSFISSSD